MVFYYEYISKISKCCFVCYKVGKIYLRVLVVINIKIKWVCNGFF